MRNRMRLYGYRLNCNVMTIRYFSNESLWSENGNDDHVDDIDTDLSKLLPLPSSDVSDENVEKVTMMKFDTLGPAVVTETGKIRFFEDWEGKTEQEKEDILKIIIPRNQQRMAKLQQLQEQQEGQQDDDNWNPSSNNSTTNDPS